MFNYVLDLTNLQYRVKRNILFQKLFYWSPNFWKFSVFSLKFQKFFLITKQFFLTVGQNNFGNKIPFGEILCFIERWRTMFLWIVSSLKYCAQSNFCPKNKNSLVCSNLIFFQSKANSVFLSFGQNSSKHILFERF